MNKSNNKQLVSKMISELEELTIKEEAQMTAKKEEKNKIIYIIDLLEVLNTSKIAFAEAYALKSEKEKDLFQKNISSIITDHQELENILKETINLYYLKTSNLLNSKYTKQQQKQAEEQLKNLIKKLTDYLKTTNKKSITEEIKTHYNRIRNIFKLANKYENETLQEEIENIDSFSDILSKTNLTFDEQESLIKTALLKNVAIYKRNLKARDLTLEKEIETQKEKTLEEPKKEVVINEATLNELDSLLNDNEVIEKIVKIIDLEFALTINFKNPTAKEQETIDAIVDIAKEEILETLAKNTKLTPYEALQNFYKNNQNSQENITSIQEKYLSDTSKESHLDFNQQLGVIEKAKKFVENQKKYLYSLNSNEKEKITQCIKLIYPKLEDRITLYKSKGTKNEAVIIKEAVFEINLLLQNIDELLKDPDNNKVIISKTVERFSEIFKALDETIKADYEKDKIEATNVFYLMHTKDRTFLEEDINFNSNSKGISNQYYPIVNQILDKLKTKEREQENIKLIHQNASVYLSNEVKKSHIGRITIFYVPIVDNNILVIGCGIYDTKDNRIFLAMDKRYKRYKAAIEEFKENFSKQVTEETIAKNKEIEENICKKLSKRKEETVESETSKLASLEEILKQDSEEPELRPKTF